MTNNNFKISESDIKETTEDEYQLFLDGFSSEETKKTYIKRLKRFLCVVLEDILDGDRELNEKQKLERLARGNKNEIKQFLDADFEARLREFVKKSKNDVKWSKNILYTYAVKQKERTTLETTNPDYLNPSTIPNLFKPIKKLFKSCGVDFNWTTIENTFPPLTNQDNSRAYTTQEIELGLQHADVQTRTAMYLYASSSIRRSGISFKWEDLKLIYRKNGKLVMGHYEDSEDSDLVCGMVIIYKGEEEQYFAMFTPETWKSIQLYKQKWHQDVGRLPKNSDPFMKKEGMFVKELNPDALAQRISKVLIGAGVRKPVTDNRKHDVPLLNGYRRWFDDVLSNMLDKQSTLGALIKRERLMGHTGLVPLDKNYFKTHWKSLVEEYLQAVPSLTISSEERTKAENKRLRKEKSEIEITKKEFEEMKKEIRLLKKYNKV